MRLQRKNIFDHKRLISYIDKVLSVFYFQNKIFCARILSMERTPIKDLDGKIGEEVKIAGWVDVRRDHGKLIFIDLRDMSGKVQMVALPSHKDAHETAGKVRSEWVLEIIGKVNKRPEKDDKQRRTVGRGGSGDNGSKNT